MSYFKNDHSSDKFSPSSLKLSQDYTLDSKTLSSVSVRKPHNQEYVRTHPDHQYRLDTQVYVEKETRCTFLVSSELRDQLEGELTNKSLILTINRHNKHFLWAIKLPDSKGNLDTWNTSAYSAAMLAQDSWVRASANMQASEYDISTALGALPEPEWLDITMSEVLEIAFKDSFIDNLDHPAIQRLHGAF